MFSAGGLRQGRERISFYARYYIGAARYSYSDCCRATRLDDRFRLIALFAATQRLSRFRGKADIKAGRS